MPSTRDNTETANTTNRKMQRGITAHKIRRRDHLGVVVVTASADRQDCEFTLHEAYTRSGENERHRKSVVPARAHGGNRRSAQPWIGGHYLQHPPHALDVGIG